MARGSRLAAGIGIASKQSGVVLPALMLLWETAVTRAFWFPCTKMHKNAQPRKDLMAAPTPKTGLFPY